MAITMDGIFVNGQKVTFAPEDILSGDASAYTEEIGTAVEEWLEENVTGGEQVTDTTLTLPGVPADAEATGDKIDELKEDLNLIADIHKPLNLVNYGYEAGYLDTGGEFVPTPSSSSQKTTNPVYLEPGNYNIDFDGMYNDSPIDYARSIAVYNSNNVCTNYYDSNSPRTSFTVLDTDSYVRINTNAHSVIKYLVYNAEYGETPTGQIRNDAIVTDETLTKNEPANAKTVGDRFAGIISIDNGIVIDESYNDWANGYIDESTGALVPTSNTQHTTNYIELQSGLSYGFVCAYVYNNVNYTLPRALAVYNTDKTFSRKVTTNSGITNVALSGNEKYIRINISYSTLTSMCLFVNKIGYGNIANTLKNSIIVPQIKNYGANYIHARRPVIAFILDGEYDQNNTMQEVFENHNVFAGFAIQYDTAFPNNPISTYFDWQRKGHEILSHSSVAVGNNGSATDSEIEQIVRDSYKTLAGYGFDIHGFVAYQGSTKPITVKNVEKWFDYGCDAQNHSATNESCMFFADDSPYMLWRYSMQLSTLQQMKDAVDRCLTNNGLLIFYGHARSSNSDNFTAENLESLLSYIDSVGGIVKTPYEAIKEYYSIRYADIVN